jgi:DNA-binding transcriptional LysR family regulator
VIAEGYDMVIRIAELDDSSLIARRLAPCRHVLCASPGYLAQHGTPVNPQELSSHKCLLYTNAQKPDTWVLNGPSGEISVRVGGQLGVDNGDMLQAAAVAGLGIVALPTFIVGEDLSAGRLQQILPEYCPPETVINAVFPSRRYLSAKVRTFVDFLSDYFGETPVWDQFRAS